MQSERERPWKPLTALVEVPEKTGLARAEDELRLALRAVRRAQWEIGRGQPEKGEAARRAALAHAARSIDEIGG